MNSQTVNAQACWHCDKPFECLRPEGGLCYHCFDAWTHGRVTLSPERRHLLDQWLWQAIQEPAEAFGSTVVIWQKTEAAR